jgi:hypothetical protein
MFTATTSPHDPAYYASEGPRVINIGSCKLEYEIAPLSDGRVTARCSCSTSESGCSYGWRVFESREVALANITATGRHTFDRTEFATNSDRQCCPQMIARLDSTLFGFEEPEPLPLSEWFDDMIADRLSTLILYQGWDLLDVVRGMDCTPMSKSGSFFDIPLPEGMKDGRYGASAPIIEDDEEDDPE